MAWIKMKDDDGFEYLLQHRGNWEIEAYRDEEDCIARILLNSTCVKAIIKKDLLTAQNEAEDWVNRMCKEWTDSIKKEKECNRIVHEAWLEVIRKNRYKSERRDS